VVDIGIFQDSIRGDFELVDVGCACINVDGVEIGIRSSNYGLVELRFVDVAAVIPSLDGQLVASGNQVDVGVQLVGIDGVRADVICNVDSYCVDACGTGRVLCGSRDVHRCGG